MLSCAKLERVPCDTEAAINSKPSCSAWCWGWWRKEEKASFWRACEEMKISAGMERRMFAYSVAACRRKRQAAKRRKVCETVCRRPSRKLMCWCRRKLLLA